MRTSIVRLALIIGLVASALPLAASAATVSITDPYPGTLIPVGVRVSFIAVGSGFNRPSYKVVDSFPGGVTSINIDAAGTFVWTPNHDDIGAHTITVTLSDLDGNEASADKTITVAESATLTAGDPSPSAAVPPGIPVTVSTSVTGLYSPSYSLKDSVPSSIQSYHITQAGVFSWTPLPSDVGAHTITLTGKDSFGSAASDDVVIMVLGDPKVSIKDVSPSSGLTAGEPLTFRALASGFASPTISVIDTGDDAATFDVDAKTGVVTWTPATTTSGTHTLRIVASETGRAATTTLAVTVSPPVASAPAPGSGSPEVTTPPVEVTAATAPTATKPPAKAKAPASASAAASPKSGAAAAPSAQPASSPSAPPAASVPLPSAHSPEPAAPVEGAQLAYPTPETYDVAPIEIPEYPTLFASDAGDVPSFGAFVREKVASFFGMIAHFFGR